MANENVHVADTVDPAAAENVFEVPSYTGPGYSPEELLQKMAHSEYEYDFAKRKVEALEVKKLVRENKTKVIMASRSFHLLQNEKLRQHLEDCFTLDPKFRITGELYEAFVYIEHQQIFDEYSFYEKLMKRAHDQHEMLGRQLSYHQTKLKQEQNERYTN